MDGWSDSEIEQSIRQLQEAHTWPGAKASTPTLAASNAARGAATAKPRMTSSLKSNGGMCVSAAVLQEFRTGLPTEQLRTHQRGCRRGNCCICRLAKCMGSWMAITQVDKDVFPYSWLEARSPKDPAWGAGCRICRLWFTKGADDNDFDDDEDEGGPWAHLGIRRCGLQRCHLKRHRRSQRHMRAVKAFLLSILARPKATVQQAGISAPPISEFVMFLGQLQKGQGYTKLHKKKSATMAWCLFEALREE